MPAFSIGQNRRGASRAAELTQALPTRTRLRSARTVTKVVFCVPQRTTLDDRSRAENRRRPPEITPRRVELSGAHHNPAARCRTIWIAYRLPHRKASIIDGGTLTFKKPAPPIDLGGWEQPIRPRFGFLADLEESDRSRFTVARLCSNGRMSGGRAGGEIELRLCASYLAVLDCDRIADVVFSVIDSTKG